MRRSSDLFGDRNLDPLPRRRPKPGSARPGPASSPGRGLRVLFLGSSLTYANEMPFIVQALARSAGETLDVSVVAHGGASLEEHLNNAGTMRTIREGGWRMGAGPVPVDIVSRARPTTSTGASPFESPQGDRWRSGGWERLEEESFQARRRTYTYVVRSMGTLRFVLTTAAWRLTRSGGRNVRRHRP